MRDDRRDRRDDVRDAQQEVASLRTRQAIARELFSLMGSRRAYDLQRQRTLIVELINLAQLEVRDSHQELREDQREKREDRRETREDHRQRH